MHLDDLRVEQLSAPLGLWTPHPRFSWLLPAGLEAQNAYELVIRDRDGAEWTSGRVESAESVLVEAAGVEAASRTAYDWRVRVWADDEADPTAWAVSTFETSILDPSEWRAQWIEPEQESVRPDGAQNFAELFSLRIETPPEDRLLPTPYVRQRFDLDGVPVRARLYATAHGIYQAELNGQPVGDQVFAPGVETYGASLSFQTYDATAAVQAGSNVFGMVLSDGWYAGRVGILGSSRGYGDRLRAFWQLHVETEDGRAHVFSSDGSARSSTRGPIRYADLAVGEGYDARLDWAGWSTPAFDDRDWDRVTVAHPDQPLVPFEGEPVRRGGCGVTSSVRSPTSRWSTPATSMTTTFADRGAPGAPHRHTLSAGRSDQAVPHPGEVAQPVGRVASGLGEFRDALGPRPHEERRGEGGDRGGGGVEVGLTRRRPGERAQLQGDHLLDLRGDRAEAGRLPLHERR